MTDALAAPTERTYGGWRRPTSVGLSGLGLLGTLVLFGGAIISIIAVAVGGILVGIPFVLLTLLALAPLTIRVGDGRTGAQWLTARCNWFLAQQAGENLYRSGPLARTGHGDCALPGLAAKLEALDARDAYGRPFALLHHPTVGHVSVVLSTSPDGASLVDLDQVDSWVAHWGHWLASLANEASLVAAAVTVETAPDTGHRLRREVGTQMAGGAPELARQVLAELVDTYPAGSAAITCRIALTWSTAPRPGQKRRTVADMAIDIGQRLPGLTTALAATGAGPARPMTTPELAAALRVAYDPAIHAEVERLGAAEADIDWTECGPIGAQEAWDHYRHDSGVSVTWQMSEAPRGAVYASSLGRLLAPAPRRGSQTGDGPVPAPLPRPGRQGRRARPAGCDLRRAERTEVGPGPGRRRRPGRRADRQRGGHRRRRAPGRDGRDRHRSRPRARSRRP